MKEWILLIIQIFVFAGIAGAIPNPSAWYCALQGYGYETRTDEQGNQYGVCVFPDGSECGAWAYYCKCEPNACSPGDFTCHWPCKEMRCKEAGESVLVSKCREGLDEIYPSHIFDTNCKKLALVGWLFLCSDCGNGICEDWESRCNCPGDCAQPHIIYVDDDASGANDGSSWADAYNYLQDALADANSLEKPVEIRVAQGVYTPDSNSAVPDGTGDREATFELVNGVTLKGGYVGFGETNPNVRDIELYETILSGDLASNDIDLNDFSDLWDEPSRAENSYHVVTGSGTDATAVLDGFTIIGGNANQEWPDPHRCGGGINGDSGKPKVANCRIIKNSATDAGGVYKCNGSISNCVIRENFAKYVAGGLRYCDGSITGCAIISNGGEGLGFCRGPIRNCTISNNDGRGLAFGGSVTNCTISGNLGGGLDGCNSVTNCTITGNSTKYDDGGGILNCSIVTNCTIAGNRAGGDGGGICCFGGHDTKLTNCILWGNTADRGQEIALVSFCIDQPWVGRRCYSSSITVSYSDVQGGPTEVAKIYMPPIGTAECILNWGRGNMGADPNFSDVVNGDYHLKSQAGRWEPSGPSGQSWVRDDVTSPCIDAGNPGCPIGDEPGPNGNRRNMGAYGGTIEASKSPTYWRSIADMTNDWIVDSNDLKIFVDYWLEAGDCIPSDFDRSRFVDFKDFAILGGWWRQKEELRI